MDALLAQALTFHFIRPIWLIATVLVLALWWIGRFSTKHQHQLPHTIAPHLAKALTVGRSSGISIRPIDSAAIVLMLLALGTAGPTWSRVPHPLVSDKAPLVITLSLSKSMLKTDVPPSRLDRSKHKVDDLLQERSGAKTALVAYAGTAHQVVPPTEDSDIFKPFLEGLHPSVMPREGDNLLSALGLSRSILETQDTIGAIVLIIDNLSAADQSAITDHTSSSNIPLLVWYFAPQDTQSHASPNLSGVKLIQVSVGSQDVHQMLRAIKTAYQKALSADDRLKWRDEGWIFLVPAALLLTVWFRKGWSMRWSAVLLAVGLGFPASDVRADGWRDWFFTPDQQAAIAFDNKAYAKAATLFSDPMWQAYSLMRLGKYQEASDLYAWQDSADAALGEGLALMRNRSYREAVTAFEKAVERDPENSAARHNLALAKYILNYVEKTREQSDTGEDSGIGSDDIRYDNKGDRGADSRQPADTGETVPETAEQWMRTVDTRTADFLKTRFSLEASRSGQ